MSIFVEKKNNHNNNMFRLSTHVECLFKCARGYRWMPDKELGYCADDGGEPDNSLEPYAKLVEQDIMMD